MSISRPLLFGYDDHNHSLLDDDFQNNNENDINTSKCSSLGEMDQPPICVSPIMPMGEASGSGGCSSRMDFAREERDRDCSFRNDGHIDEIGKSQTTNLKVSNIKIPEW